MLDMNVKQRTIKSDVHFSGVGLHTGKQVNVTLKPADENHWYKFKRIDLEGQPIVNVDADNVSNTARGTTISQNGASVSTIEHLMAALVGLQLDNVLIEIDGPEVPILDGSSAIFIDKIQEVGFHDQDADREYFEVTDNIHYTDPESKV
jgi:UDP-3-O-[3-hydroxymyristoyl] N-acetylglucosamine deacetylase/3-hydroxyacyl-[acyl-carrier-protein] dehydratase